jgi:hypothetical protein
MEILKFLWEPGNIERLREGFQYVATLTKEGWDQLADTISYDRYGVDRRFFGEIDGENLWRNWGVHYFWPSLSTGTDAVILNIIAQAAAEKYVPILSWLDAVIANQNYKCEWAYVVDLDQNTFEVFGGSETKQEASTTRFNDVGGDDAAVPALLKSFSFSQLPATEKEFVRTLKAAMKDKGNDTYRLFLKFYGDATDLDDEEEVDKLLEERTGGTGNSNDAVEADK